MATAAHRALNVGDIQSNERSSGSTWCDAGTGTLFIIIKSKMARDDKGSYAFINITKQGIIVHYSWKAFHGIT